MIFSSSHCFSATLIEHAPLEAIYIYFDTATYDEIERDVKVNLCGLRKKGNLTWKHLLGHHGGSTRAHRRHNGPSYWILYSQWL